MSIKPSSARQKGRSGELEVINHLQLIVNEVYGARGVPAPELSRSPHGRDMHGIPWIALEVKRHQPSLGYQEVTHLQKKEWWEQAKSQASGDQVPVLCYRANHQPWRTRMFGYVRTKAGARVKTPVDIDFKSFLIWFREQLEEMFQPPKS